MEHCRSEGADEHIRKILQSLDKEYWKLLLEYVRDWNAKPKSCHVAQRVLYEFFSVVPASKMVEVCGLLPCIHFSSEFCMLSCYISVHVNFFSFYTFHLAL
jgi:hypothetical protein